MYTTSRLCPPAPTQKHTRPHALPTPSAAYTRRMFAGRRTINDACRFNLSLPPSPSLALSLSLSPSRSLRHPLPACMRQLFGARARLLFHECTDDAREAKHLCAMLVALNRSYIYCGRAVCVHRGSEPKHIEPTPRVPAPLTCHLHARALCSRYGIFGVARLGCAQCTLRLDCICFRVNLPFGDNIGEWDLMRSCFLFGGHCCRGMGHCLWKCDNFGKILRVLVFHNFCKLWMCVVYMNGVP